jgi:subtilisin family serine protease
MVDQQQPDDRERLRTILDRSLITTPLLNTLDRAQTGPEGVAAPAVPATVKVVVDLNFDYVGGTAQAAQRVRDLIAEAVESVGLGSPQGVDEDRTLPGGQYVVAALEPAVVRQIAEADRRAATKSRSAQAIYRIWPDFKVRPHTTKSIATVKVDAARSTFSAWGEGIVWAVLDSGIDGKHPHFKKFKNLDLEAPLEHRDFVGGKSALTDEFGHGTHVAGILAGYAKSTRSAPINAARRVRDESGQTAYDTVPITEISGMAPKAKLVSFKVLDANGDGETSTIIAALQEISRINDNGRDIKIHGVNLSVGYPFDPEWFACGHSPLCNEVNQLTATGVVVVVSAGNTGYGWNQDFSGDSSTAAGLDVTINDPGNADRAITVGSTHRDSPHQYGVSFFSSKGPTGDGRLKPDLVAPGERILAPAAGRLRSNADGKAWDYLEDSGTSMAAPHVSGAIAAFLSVRNEFIGKPDRVKEIFTGSAVDLRRVRDFQGNGLVDLLHALQSV